MFIKPTVVKKEAHLKGRRVSRSFIQALDAHVQRLIDRAAAVHNGGRVTLDGDLLWVILAR